MSGTIVILRELRWSFRARAFKVKIDGVVIGKIGTGSKVEYIVTPGMHEVQLLVDWYRSPALSVEVGSDNPCTLIARPGAFLDAFIRPHRYLSLAESG
jgi:hypothetical protein